MSEVFLWGKVIYFKNCDFFASSSYHSPKEKDDYFNLHYHLLNTKWLYETKRKARIWY